MELLQDAIADNELKWAEYAASSVRLLKIDKDNNNYFNEFVFRGNFGVEQGKELKVIQGSYSNRYFSDVQDEYLLIKSRQI